MKSRHAHPLRGLTANAITQHKPGLFGKMFPSLSPASFGANDQANKDALIALGSAIVASVDAPKDGPDSEESGIPALYTYFGQFIDHDLTFDPASELQKQQDPDGLVDFRTPAFDLDNVYGRGNADQPYLYDGGNGNGNQFLLGAPLSGGEQFARDLLRNGAFPNRAIIGDPRNDENVIVSQFQGLILRFHNHAVRDFPNKSFQQINEFVRHHYQYVMLHDFLPKIVSNAVLSQLKGPNGHYQKAKLHWYHPGTTVIGGTSFSQAYMPVEFSVAAYRLGHSMVRPGYRLNEQVLLPIFPLPGFPAGLTGFAQMPQDWGIDWGRFIDIDLRPSGGTPNAPGEMVDQQRRLQFAYRIDTSTVAPLGNLPASIAGGGPISLPIRNLLRGWALKLPSGQAVATAMGVPVLSDADIEIGKFGEPGNPTMQSLIASNAIPASFTGNTPLWIYILAEAMRNAVPMTIPVEENVGNPSPTTVMTPQLGPVGGRLVAETFLGILFADASSLLHRTTPLNPALTVHRPGKTAYTLADFVNYALT